MSTPAHALVTQAPLPAELPSLTRFSTTHTEHLQPPTRWLPRTKFFPPFAPPNLILRTAQLTALQGKILTHRLTLLTGPAGYGKSALLASYYFQLHATSHAAKQPAPPSTPAPKVYWLSLDSEDNDPAIFTSALLQALELTELPAKGIQSGVTGPLELPPPAEGAIMPHVVIGRLVNAIMEHEGQPLVLLLDECHLVDAMGVYQLLDSLLTHLPPQLHLVMASRAAPPLALARLSSRGQLAEYTMAQLAFNLAETGELLNDHFQLGLSAADLRTIHTYTEGWAAGLRFVATALQACPGELDRTMLVAQSRHEPQLLATQSYLYDYLANEVLHQQTPRIHLFLLQSSILTELTPEACQRVTGNFQSAEVLEDLQRHNLFIVRDKHVAQTGASHSTTIYYRYQTIFAQFLRDRLTLELPTMVQELHQRASTLEGLSWETRIGHALQAQAWPLVTRLLTEMGSTLLQENSPDTLLLWLAQLPPAVVAQQPALCFLAGFCQWLKGDGRAATTQFEQAFAQFAAQGQAADQGNTLSYWAASLLLSGDYQGAAAKLAQASAYPLTGDAQLQCQLTQLWLSLNDTPPQWRQAEQSLLELLTAPVPNATKRASLRNIHLSSSCLLLMLDNVRPALLESCQQASAELPPPDPWWQIYLDNLQAWSAWLQGAVEQAQSTLEHGLALCHRLAPGIHPIEAELLVLQSSLAMLRQDFRAAQQYLQTVREQPSTQARWLYCTYSLAHAHCEVGQLTAAHQLYAELQVASRAPAHPQGQIYCLMLGGLLEMSVGAYVRAEELLQEAVALEPHYRNATLCHSPRLLLAYLYLQWKGAKAALAIFLPFFHTCLRQNMPALLYQGGRMTLAMLTTATRQHAATAQTLAFRSKLERDMQIALPHLPETGLRLSRREMAVLELLTAGASNRFIAEQLNITLPTVKSHLTRLFSKLNVTSRQAAVTRARELGLH